MPGGRSSGGSGGPRGGRPARALHDLLSQVSAAALYGFSAAVFIGVAIAGLSMLGRLGSAGWLIYVVCMTVFSLMFGPLVASAAKISQKGNPRWRAQRDERIAADRRKYAMSLRPDERAADSDSGRGGRSG